MFLVALISVVGAICLIIWGACNSIAIAVFGGVLLFFLGMYLGIVSEY